MGQKFMVEIFGKRPILGMILSIVVFVQYLGLLLTGLAEQETAVFKGQTFLSNLLQSLMNFHYRQNRTKNQLCYLLLFLELYRNYKFDISFKDQITGDVEFYSWNYTGDKLQENKQCEVRFNFLAILSHGVGHGLEDIGVLAGVDCRHHGVLHEGEFLYGEGFVQVLFLDVLLDILVADWLAVEVGGTEKHPGSVIVLIVYNVHGVVSQVLLLGDFLLGLIGVQDNNFLAVLRGDFLFLALLDTANPFLALDFLQDKVLFFLVEILGCVCRVERGHPLPAGAHFGQFITRSLELLGGQFTIFLELLGLGWRVDGGRYAHLDLVQAVLGCLPH